MTATPTQSPTRSPSYYHALVDFAVEAGELMMTSGAETHRVEDTVTRILTTANVPRADVFVISTGLTVTLSYEPTHTITVTRRIGRGSNNLGRVSAVNQISREFCNGDISLDEAKRLLHNAARISLYSTPQQIVGAAISASAFAYMFGGTIPDALAAAVCGLIIGLATVLLQPRLHRTFVTVALSSLIMALTATTLTFLCNTYLGMSLQSQYLIVGGIMPVVPGVAITNAIRDMLQGDYVSACARILDAFITAAAVAVGIGAGFAISRELGFVLTLHDFVFGESDSVGLQLAWEAIAAFLSCFGFCFLLNVPRRLVIPSSLGGMICWEIYLIGGILQTGGAMSALIASAAVYLLAYVLARHLKAPVSVFLIVSILPLVPGCNIYRTAYSMIIGEGSTADALVATLTMAGAIALGIFIADMINDMIKQMLKKHADKPTR